MEENKIKKLLIKYGITTLIGVAIAFAIMCGRGVLAAASVAAAMGYISDGFFVVGMLYTGFGLLLAISSTGVFDMLGYAFKSLIYLFTPMRIDRGQGGFYEYKMRKKEQRKAVPLYILWVGLAFIALAGIFVAVYFVI